MLPILSQNPPEEIRKEETNALIIIGQLLSSKNQFNLEYEKKYESFKPVANQPIKSNSVITTYSGQFKEKNKLATSEYLMDMQNSIFVIDSSEIWNFSRFINHSSEAPNCSAIYDSNIKQVIMISNRDINEHEELAFNYDWLDDGYSKLHIDFNKNKRLASNLSADWDAYINISGKLENEIELIEKNPKK